MSNLKKIGNKLFKETTELKSHEVELKNTNLSAEGMSSILTESKSIFKNIEKSSKESKKIVSMFKKNISSVAELKRRYLSNKKQISSIQKSLNKNFDTIYKQANQLGVDIREVPAYKEYLSAKKTINESSDLNQDFWTDLSKYA